ncbi:MAG: T9SS type B sorting domain-containing protein [Jejuia sp.]
MNSVNTYQNILLIILFILSFGVSKAQTTFVPDDNFEQALINLGLDTPPLDDVVPTVNIASIKELNVSLLGINDLTGIEDFSDLEVLECSENNLTVLDISNNGKLRQLFCSFNAIENLDVSNNPELSILWCNFNRINNLDTSNNLDLLSFICSNNLLTTLDISKNTFLNTFFCVGNQLANLDVTSNAELRILHCGNNSINTLDVSENLLLYDFNFEYNTIKTIDLSNNTELEFLYCLSNNLIDLNLSNNPNLAVLSCGENQLTEIDVQLNTNLRELYCEKNQIQFLDLSTNRFLNSLNCSNNNLCQLNVKNTNNSNVLVFDTSQNNELACIFVDNVAYSQNNWTAIDAQSSFVSNLDECADVLDNFIAIDSLNDVVAASYILPNLTFGSYFTEPFGNGIELSAGSTITNSQTIYIYNQNNCYENQSSFNVFITVDGLFIPKYFTPNNDGINDYWKVIDTNNSISKITIFNRYGKLLKYLPSNSKGWNGTLNNQILPNDTYWYEMVLNTNEILRGYFALKR